MRIYELAREYGVTSKDILKVLHDSGIELASHMAVVPDNGQDIVKKHFGKKEEPKAILKKEIKKEEKVQVEEIKEIPTPVKKNDKEMQIEKNEKLTEDLIFLEDEEELLKKPIVKSFSQPKAKIGPKKIEVPVKKIDSFDEKNLKQKFFKKEITGPRVVTEITIEKSLPLFEVAEMMGKNPGDLIIALLKKGMACNRNHILSTDIISSLAEQFGIKAIVKNVSQAAASFGDAIVKKVSTGSLRWPIVVVMGHVDHGKTTLLDYIRKMNTAAKEKGGITQHLGAYEVSSTHGNIVFLDTPGHEAFSYVRSRGAKITDLAILVVAADDGVKPQTIEAIQLAKQANVPIIVAINKIDKIPSPAYMQTVKRQLAQHDVVTEDWGGAVVAVPISAKTGQGIDELLEMIILQAQLMDLKSDPTLPAKAFILESKLEKGFGPVATVICSEGSIKVGDYFVCGSSTGKVRLLVNSYGQKINKAGPSIPVKVVGFDKFVEFGEWLNVVDAKQYQKAKASKEVIASSPNTAQNLFISENIKKINLMIKTDTKGSLQALQDSLEKISKKFKKDYPEINLIYSAIGDVTEKDIDLAVTSDSLILTLHVKVEKNAMLVAKDKGVQIESFDIIYHLLERIEGLLEERKEVKYVWNKVAELGVKKVFDIKKIGIVAGCGVKEGVVSRGNKVVCMRAGKQVGEGLISSLQRDTKSVKEVHAGYECGFVCDGFSEWQDGDTVLVYAKVKDLSGAK